MLLNGEMPIGSHHPKRAVDHHARARSVISPSYHNSQLEGSDPPILLLGHTDKGPELPAPHMIGWSMLMMLLLLAVIKMYLTCQGKKEPLHKYEMTARKDFDQSYTE